MARTRVETRARARALQALYAWDMRGNDRGELERVATQVWDDLSITADERRIAGPIVRVVASKGSALDDQLADVTTNWRLERIGAVERCVLRLAAAELTIGDTPPRVVIQEAVTLAERFGSAASARFVNGVLDALARRMGRI
ncbi:MAG TPA: transcription antitermination factor NusB [Gemmatimonadaceae bacterium]|nr:transcription antitermination factor NusB [Gemmatimonadaceae bacterium]